MSDGLKTIIYPVRDLAPARTMYSTFLGVKPHMDEPYYVGFSVADQDRSGGRVERRRRVPMTR